MSREGKIVYYRYAEFWKSLTDTWLHRQLQALNKEKLKTSVSFGIHAQLYKLQVQTCSTFDILLQGCPLI